MATLITHIFNEEFLLPYFIENHKDKFDKVFVIDYGSTDNSIEIIRDLTPNWEIVNSPTKTFDPIALDRLVMHLEESISGPRLALTVTEFLIGDPNSINGQVIIPTVSLVNMESDSPFLPEIPFHDQRKFGIRVPPILASDLKVQNQNFRNLNSAAFLMRNETGRSIHDKPIKYATGRHFQAGFEGSFLIYRVANCFVNKQMFERRLQIQTRLNKSNSTEFLVSHSNFGKGLKVADLLELEIQERHAAQDLGYLIKKQLALEAFSVKTRASRPALQEENLIALDLIITLESTLARCDIDVRNLLLDFNREDLFILKNLPEVSHRGKKILVLFLRFLKKITLVFRNIKGIGFFGK